MSATGAESAAQGAASAALAAGANAPDPRERLRAALGRSTEALQQAGVPSPSVDARALIVRAGEIRGPLVMVDALPADFEERLEGLVARRASREPLQLILGEAPFRRLLLRTRAGVFIPRPETELMIDHLLEFDRVHGARLVVDLCTGSGAIAAAVLDELPAAHVVAVELDAAAAQLAAENIAAAARSDGPGSNPQGGAPEAEPRWELHVGDATDPSVLASAVEPGTADAVLSNPPYVPAGAVPREREVREHDPAAALYGGGEDGLEIPAALIARAAALLRTGGLLVMEHADVQGPALRDLAEATGAFADIRTDRDLTGRDRFLVARRRPRGDGESLLPPQRNERLAP